VELKSYFEIIIIFGHLSFSVKIESDPLLMTFKRSTK